MTKPEWGTKRTCKSCNARFYDMERVPVICPKCGAEFVLLAAVAPIVEVVPEPEEQPKKSKAIIVDDENIDLEDVELDDLELEDVSDDEDDDLMEDTSELDDDEDDMSEVMEHLEAEDDL